MESFGAGMEYLPAAPETVPFRVPSTTTVTQATGAPSSPVTVPCTRTLCASARRHGDGTAQTDSSHTTDCKIKTVKIRTARIRLTEQPTTRKIPNHLINTNFHRREREKKKTGCDLQENTRLQITIRKSRAITSHNIFLAICIIYIIRKSATYPPEAEKLLRNQ